MGKSVLSLAMSVDGLAGRKSNIWLGGGASVAGQLLKKAASIRCGCR